MEEPKTSARDLSKTEESPIEAASPLEDADELVAWRAIEGDLWIPHRIRGSWRGGVLGWAFKVSPRAGKGGRSGKE